MKTINSSQPTSVGKAPESALSEARATRDIVNKGMNELAPGDRFKAIVTDIQPGRVTLRLNDGGLLTARSMVLPDARIGEESVFIVKENAKGQILMEMFKPEGELPTNFIKEALSNASLYATEENIEVAGHMLKNGFPVDAESLQKAAYFRHTDASADLDKVLFLLKEDFEASSVTTEGLVRILDKTTGLTKNLSDVIDLLFKNEMFETEGKRAALAMLGMMEKNGEEELKLNLKEKLEKKFFIDINDISDKSLSEYYKELYKSVNDAKKVLSESAQKNEVIEELIKELSNVQENIEFTNHIKNYKEYMQIPFIFENVKNQGDLYIFKDRKGQKNFNEQASVLISINYMNIGSVEVFVTKTKNALNFQFKASDDALKVISNNSKKLSEALYAHGFTISGISYKNLDEPFNVTKEIENPNQKNKPSKRFSFDMRV